MSPFREQYFLWKVATYGDPRAFEELYNKYHRSVYQFLAFRLARREDAEDMTALVFTRAWEYLASEQNEIKNFRAFIYRIARNLLADFYRSASNREKNLSIDEAQAQDRPIDIPDLRDLFEAQVLASDEAMVGRALLTLKPEYREVLTLRFMGELSLKEIAQVLEKESGTVAVTLHRAKEALAKAVAQLVTGASSKEKE